MKRLTLLLFLLTGFAGASLSAQCVDCEVMVCDGVNCDDGSNADGVQTSRKCGCGTAIGGACAQVEVNMNLNPYFDPNDPNCSLIFTTQEQGNFSIYIMEENCTVTDCATPDFVVSSGAALTGLPSSGVFDLMICKNGGNAGRRDFSFSVSCSTVENCVNGIDDNNDNFIDCDDADCSLDTNCSFSDTSSGNDGGLESNRRLVKKITRRNFLRTKSGTRNPTIQRPDNRFQPAPGGFAKNFDPDNLVLSDYVSEQAIAGAEFYVSSPTDLTDITNADQVFSVDIFQQKQRIASIFATRSYGGVYEHTKFICDRLHGARIDQVWDHAIDGKHDFIVTKFQRPDGVTEYACNFSVFVPAGAAFQLESHWNLYDYSPDQTYLNFQVWANNMGHLEALVQETLDRIAEQAPIATYRTTPAPRVYVRQVRYDRGQLQLDIANPDGARQLDIQGEVMLTETGLPQPLLEYVPLSGATQEVVAIPTNGLYNLGIALRSPAGAVPDGVYVADGTWSVDYAIGGAMIYDFEVFPGTLDPGRSGHPVERNILFQGTLREGVAVYRSLNPAFRPVDMSAYDQLRFNARGAGDWDVTVVRASVAAWEDQMKTSFRLDGDWQEVTIPLARFYAGDHPLDWSDVTLIVFSQRGDGQTTRSFSLQLEDLYFERGNDLATTTATALSPSSCFPNPMVAQARVSFFTLQAADYTFQLLSAEGTVLQEMKGATTAGVHQLWIRNENYPTGIYFYRITLTNGDSFGGQLVILTP